MRITRTSVRTRTFSNISTDNLTLYTLCRYAFPPPKRDPGARVNIRKNVPKLFAQESVINDTVPIIREVAQLGREVAQTWITIALTVWWVILLLVGILVAVVVVKRSDM